MRLDLYKKRTVYVYKITNKINSKIYIGVTGNIKQRWNEHKNAVKRKCFYLQRAINKYGINNFIIEQIEKCNCYFDAFKKETYWIKHYNSRNNKFGYNLTLGGEGGSAGESSTSAKLKETQVLEILTKFSTGEFTYLQLGKKYSVDSTTIGYIVRFQNWPEMKDKISDEIKNKILLARNKNRNLGKFSEENALNKDKSGREMRRGKTKLNELNIVKIKELYSTGKYSMKKLGEIFGVYDSQICRVINNKVWAYV